MRVPLRGFLRLVGLGPRAPEASLPAPPPDGLTRLHFFNGADSEARLLAYCFETPEPNTPEAFTNDLPEAFVDTDFLEVRHDADPVVALNDMRLSEADLKRLARQASGPGWVVAEEDAWGGFPFRLHDTPRLRYLGTALVDWST